LFAQCHYSYYRQTVENRLNSLKMQMLFSFLIN
jgi:hypothetical protein